MCVRQVLIRLGDEFGTVFVYAYTVYNNSDEKVLIGDANTARWL